MLVSYEREVANIDSYYFVETMDIAPAPLVRHFEKKVENGRSIFREVPLAELAKREQLADPTLSADQRAIAERPQLMLGGLATAFEFLAKGLGIEEAAKPLTDGLRGVEADLDAEMGGLLGSADDVGGLLGPETEALFREHTAARVPRLGEVWWNLDSPGLVPHFSGPWEFERHFQSLYQVTKSRFDGVYDGNLSITILDGQSGDNLNAFPCYILGLPRDVTVAGFPHRLVSADMWICALGPGVAKPVRTRVEYVTNAGDASAADLIVGGTRPVVIDQISFDHLTVGSMHPFSKFVQSISGLSESTRVVRKLRRNFTVNKTPTQAEIVEAIAEDFGRAGVIE